jgi:AcrR family transcriptional regulator
MLKSRAAASASRSRNPRGSGDRLRGEIIDAAITLLAALGPEKQFSLRSVAKEAKIAAPSIYIHFADRTALLLAVLEKLFSEQIAVRAAAEEAAPWRRPLGTPFGAVDRKRRIRS